MFKIFAFKVFEEFVPHRKEYIDFNGKAYGLFLVSPIHRNLIYGSREEYADRDLKELNWWQKILYKEKIEEYKSYLRGELDLGDGRGWSGFRPISICLPFRFKTEYQLTFANDDGLIYRKEVYAIFRTAGRSDKITKITYNNESFTIHNERK